MSHYGVLIKVEGSEYFLQLLLKMFITNNAWMVQRVSGDTDGSGTATCRTMFDLSFVPDSEAFYDVG